MLISKTPLRISVTGGGSDIKNFYSAYGGEVVSFAINRYVYVTAFFRLDDKIVLSYRLLEEVHNVNKLKNTLVRECLKEAGILKGIEIHLASEIPTIGTGLGGSSAITVGCLNVLFALKGVFLTKEQLAVKACRVEIDLLGKEIGKQDQYACAYGGLNRFEFLPSSAVIVTPILNTDNLTGKFSLVNATDNSRLPAELLLSKQNKRIKKNIGILIKMKKQCGRLVKAIVSNDEKSIIKILNRSWDLKKQLSEQISSPSIDKIINLIRDDGGAGKLCGAGQAGYIASYFPFDRSIPIKTIPVEIDGEGTRLIQI